MGFQWVFYRWDGAIAEGRRIVGCSVFGECKSGGVQWGWLNLMLLGAVAVGSMEDFLGCLWGWVYFAPGASRVSARQPSYFFLLRQKKVTKKKASHVRALRVPCATRSVRGTCKLASPEISTPLNRLRRFPLQGTTPAARQSRFRSVPGRGCASRTSPQGLVRCAHLAGCWGCLIPLPSLLSRARHAVPLHQTPSFLTLHFASWATTRVAPTPSLLTPTTSFLTPTTSFLTPHPSLLTPHFASWATTRVAPTPSLLTPHSSLLTPHSSLLTPHSSLLTPTTSFLIPHPSHCKRVEDTRWQLMSC